MQNIRALISKKIRDLRKKAGLTQERFAEAADLSVDVIGKIERGRTTPALDTLVKISTALDIPLSELLDFRGPPRTLSEEIEKLRLYLATKDLESVRFAGRIIREIMDHLENR